MIRNIMMNHLSHFVKYDRKIAFFDAISLAIMKKENIYEIISFDKYFDNKDIVRIQTRKTIK